MMPRPCGVIAKETNSHVFAMSALRIGIAQNLAVAGNMREAAEVDGVVVLDLAGREALVAAGGMMKASPVCTP